MDRQAARIILLINNPGKVFKTLSLFFCLTVFPAIVYPQGGMIKTYYDEAHEYLKEYYRVKDHKSRILEGDYTSYYLNGKVKTHGFYFNNKPDGMWTYYYENGNIKMRGRLKGDLTYGFWRYYYENGKPSMEGEMKNGLREGLWKFYFESGLLKSEGKFREGNKSDIWNYYYEDGTLKAQAFYNEGNGFYKEFYTSGIVKMRGYYKDEKSDSLWTYFYENGNIQAEGPFQEGLKNGKWIYYYENKNKSSEGEYKDGEKSGKWIYYYENGRISAEGAEINGQRDGYWKLYSPGGDFIGDGNFSRGTGDYKEYHANGNLKISGKVVDGKNEGTWNYYYEDGTPEGECIFAGGEGIYTGYYPSGRIKMKGKISDNKNTGQWELFDENGSLTGYYKPVYENDKPVFKVLEKKEETPQAAADNTKPQYIYKKKTNRHFTPVINEFAGLIIATNPTAVILGSLPITLEFYYQERLGHEIQLNIIRDPFFASDKSIQANSSFKRGFDVAFRQKLYNREGSLGIFYIANELRYTNTGHFANVVDSTSSIENQELRIKASENKFEYSFLLGNRWVKLFGERMLRDKKQNGITVDIYVGLGLGYRLYEKKYEDNPAYDEIFNDLHQGKFAITPRFAVNLGYIF